MTETKISDFKMFEKAPYKLPEPKVFIEITNIAMKEQEKTYGPVFNVKYIKNVLEFITKKIGEKPPQDIKTLEQLTDYLVSISHKYPTAYSAIPYAEMKTEKELQGQTGAGFSIATISIGRKAVKSPSCEKRSVDLDGLLSKYRQTLIEMGVAMYEFGYKKKEDGSVDIIYPTCYLKDGCQMALHEGFFKRVVGGFQCSHCSGLLPIFKLLTGYDWDYTLLEFDKPHCIANVFMF